MDKYYGVFLCGDDFPEAIFWSKSAAEKWPEDRPHWMDKEIIEINLNGSEFELDRNR